MAGNRGPLVFVAQKTDKGPYLADGNEKAKTAFQKWTGTAIPTYEKVESHKLADLEAWNAFESHDLGKISSMLFYQEKINGHIYETIKIPVNEEFIVIVTRPL